MRTINIPKKDNEIQLDRILSSLVRMWCHLVSCTFMFFDRELLAIKRCFIEGMEEQEKYETHFESALQQ